jgi:hypothetical protein
MADIVERLRHYVNGPFARGRKYSVSHIASGEELLEAADTIDQLREELSIAQRQIAALQFLDDMQDTDSIINQLRADKAELVEALDGLVERIKLDPRARPLLEESLFFFRAHETVAKHKERTDA